jgi:hypothetical protein
MSSFKVGDKVRFESRWSSGALISEGTGVVEFVCEGSAGRTRYEVRAESGQLATVFVGGDFPTVDFIAAFSDEVAVGDRVEFFAADQDPDSGRGTVTRVRPTVGYHVNPDGLEGSVFVSARGGWYPSDFVRKIEAEPAPKFKVGDRVRAVAGNKIFLCAGDEFTIVSTDLEEEVDDIPCRYGLSWENDDGESCDEDDVCHGCDEALELVETPIGTVVTYDPAVGPPGYHERKFDAGKTDWTLVPANAAGEILTAALYADECGLPLLEEEDEPADAAAGFMLEFRATGDREALAQSLTAFDGSALEKLAKAVDVLGFGAKKYGRDSWRLVPDAIDRYYSAAMRHLAAMATGETHDPESGLEHLGHFACNVLFLLELTR